MLSRLGAYLRFLGPYRRPTLGVILLLLPAHLVLLRQVFNFLFINEVVLRSNLDLLVVLVIAIACVVLTARYFYGVGRLARERLGQRFIADVRGALFARVMEQPPPFFARRSPGELVALVGSQVDAIDAVHESLVFSIVGAVYAVLTLVMCFIFDPGLALLVLTPFPVLALLRVMEKPLHRRARAALDTYTRFVTFLKLRFSHVLTIQAFTRERTEAERAARLARDVADARSRGEAISQASQRIFDVAREWALIAIFLVGGVRIVRDGDVSLGAVMAIFSLAGQLYYELMDVYRNVVRGQMALTTLDATLALFTEAPPRRDAGRALPGRPRGAIELDRVWFSYDGGARWALRDVSFSVAPGGCTAVVGLSGSGKSTLLQLLLRQYDPDRGAIRLDGLDLRRIDPRSLRQHLGIATQEAVILTGSVADNIAYGRDGASELELAAAVRVARADGFVQALPHGMETLVGEGAAGLSGGQAHRVALARVVLKDAPVLLLDEATAGLDAKTEAELQETLNEFMRGRTSIVVAHRLATVMRADEIVVLDKGEVVQRGTHAQLHADEKGLYRFLFDRQFKDVFHQIAAAG
jgi:ATP-binding cassette, subfamily B, bacterial